MLSDSVRTFSFSDTLAIRVVTLEGAPWFVAADVCSAIGLVNGRDAIEKLDSDEKDVASTDTQGGRQALNVVSESGLYTLILRCRGATKPGTMPHRFRKWVTAEVLPAIRQAGRYEVPAPAPLALVLPGPKGAGAGHSAVFHDLLRLRDALASHDGARTICDNTVKLLARYGSVVEEADRALGAARRIVALAA